MLVLDTWLEQLYLANQLTEIILHLCIQAKPVYCLTL